MLGNNKPGETNQAYLVDEPAPVEEAIQVKALPWRRGEDEAGNQQPPKVQEEFPPWINNKDYLAYDSPSNTLMGKQRWQAII